MVSSLFAPPDLKGLETGYRFNRDHTPDRGRPVVVLLRLHQLFRQLGEILFVCIDLTSSHRIVSMMDREPDVLFLRMEVVNDHLAITEIKDTRWLLGSIGNIVLFPGKELVDFLDGTSKCIQIGVLQRWFEHENNLALHAVPTIFHLRNCLTNLFC